MYNIIQGSRTDSNPPFLIRLKVDNVTYDPFDLTAVTNITACFLNADDTELTLTLGSGISILGNPILGKILISLTAAQTKLLAVTDAALLELSITTTGDPFKVRLDNAYAVIASAC